MLKTWVLKQRNGSWEERRMEMITILIIIGIVVILGGLFGLAFSITGALIGALLWVLKLPVALALWIVGIVCCCTIILIPVGLLLFKTGSILLIV